MRSVLQELVSQRKVVDDRSPVSCTNIDAAHRVSAVGVYFQRHESTACAVVDLRQQLRLRCLFCHCTMPFSITKCSECFCLLCAVSSTAKAK